MQGGRTGARPRAAGTGDGGGRRPPPQAGRSPASRPRRCGLQIFYHKSRRQATGGGKRVPGMRKAPGRGMRAGAGRAGGDYLWMAVPVAGVCRAAEWERQATGGEKGCRGCERRPAAGCGRAPEGRVGIICGWRCRICLPGPALHCAGRR